MAKEIGSSSHKNILSPEELEAKLKKEYQAAIAAAVLAAQKYDGSKETYESLMDSLSYLDEVIRTIPDLEGDLLEDKDMNAAIRFTPGEERDMSDIITIASASLRVTLQQSLAEQKEDELSLSSFRIHRLSGIVLAPRTQEMPTITGEGNRPFEKPRFDQQLSRLMKVLQDMNIFSNDVLISIGDVNPKSWRDVSYAVVEIPELNRTVLVCDQVGEASYVIRQLVPARDVFTTEEQTGLQKQTLPERYGTEKVILVRRGEHWSEGIRAALSSDEIERSLPRHKIDMAEYEREDVRQAILKQLPTIESWIDAVAQRLNLKAAGLKMTALKTLFNVVDDKKAADMISYFLLGREVYGSSPRIAEEIKKAEQRRSSEKRTKEEWRHEIVKKFPTAKQWIDEAGKMREDGSLFHMDGAGIMMIGGIFGLQSRGISPQSIAVEVAKYIYGEDDKVIRRIEERREQDRIIHQWDKEEWTRRLQEKYPTAESWIQELDRHEPFVFEHATLNTVCTLFKVPCMDDHDTIALLRLAKKLHGSDESFDTRIKEIVIKQKTEVEARTPEEWITRLKEKYPTSTERVEMTADEKRGRIDGLMLLIIAKKLEMNPESTRYLSPKEFYILGTIVYGMDDILEKKIQEETIRVDRKQDSHLWSVDKWRSEVQKEISPKQWVTFRVKDITKHFIGGRQIKNLGGIFGMKLLGRGTFLHHLYLGKEIYGKDNKIINDAIEQYERDGVSAK